MKISFLLILFLLSVCNAFAQVDYQAVYNSLSSEINLTLSASPIIVCCSAECDQDPRTPGTQPGTKVCNPNWKPVDAVPTCRPCNGGPEMGIYRIADVITPDEDYVIIDPMTKEKVSLESVKSSLEKIGRLHDSLTQIERQLNHMIWQNSENILNAIAAPDNQLIPDSENFESLSKEKEKLSALNKKFNELSGFLGNVKDSISETLLKSLLQKNK